MTKKEFIKRFPIKLNEQQWEAVQAVDGPTLLLAVPGSGKTTVLVARIGYMILCCGVNPGQIMTITYTRAAAADMKTRFANLFGSELADQLDFRTINSLCLDIIKTCGKGRNVYDIIRDSDASAILNRLFLKYEEEYPTESDLQGIQTRISYIKNMMLSEREIAELGKKDGIHLTEIFHEYNRVLKDSNQMDFDDQMVYALTIFNKFPNVLKEYQDRYPYICVDEAQDTSKIQHKVIALLASGAENLFMVGDEDQSIYGFRAAYPRALLDFEKDHQGSRVLLMENNYRSNARIVDAADGFIQKNTLRHKKTMHATRPAASEIEEISLRSRRAQYSYLIKVAERCSEQSAVLYRYNESVIPLVDMLERKGLPYRIKGADFTFFTSRVVKDISGIMRMAIDPYDTETFMQVYFKMSTYLKKGDAEKACYESRRRRTPVLDAAIEFCNLNGNTIKNIKSIRTHLENMCIENGDKAVYRITHFMGYGDYMERNNMNDRKVEILQTLGENEKTPAAFLQRLDRLHSLLQEQDTDRSCPFILSTIHSSKGLEYNRVYLMDVADGIFPENIPIGKAPDTEVQEYEEERRLFYVGATRAKDHLMVFRFEKKATFTDQLLGREKKAPKDVSRQKKKGNALKYDRFYDAPVISDGEVSEFVRKLGEGLIVEHKKFGKGSVVRLDKKTVTIDFGEEEKTFDLKVLCASKLLKAI